MRQFAERLEGRSPLKVNQYEVDDPRIIFDRQTCDQGQQQFRLSGSGRSGNHSVNAVSALLGGHDQLAHIPHAGHRDRRP